MAIFALSFFFACEEEDDDDEIQNDTQRIEGKWERDRDGLIVSIEGSTGEIVDCGDGLMQDAVDQGFVEIGDRKFKDIKKEGSKTWSFHDLWVYIESGPTILDTYWTDRGSLTLGADSDTITTDVTGSYGGSSNTIVSTYIKVSN